MNQHAMQGNAKHKCDAQPLNTLLDGDESSAEYSAVAMHVEACAECQHRLELLAADHLHWDEVGNLLRDTGDGPQQDLHLRDTQELANANDQAAAAMDRRTLEHLRGVLATAKHPEMLGRLGRYDVESVVGRGGMGIVLRAFDTELHRPVAIKILASHLAHSGPARQRFARESRAAAAVVHEHVVAIHDVQTDGETPYLVMQFVAGESLQARVERQGPLSATEILRIGMQAAAGLHAAHVQGVVHRDVKPANILLEPGVERALLTDFGLARTVDEASLTQTGIVAGSPHYMSPEQAQGKATDVRTDIFSLGAVLYFMATGHPPFRAERAMGVLNRICHEPHRPVWELHPEIPDALSDIIDRCLQKKDSRRYATAAELHEVLGRTLARLQHRPLRSSPSMLRRLRRKRVGVAAALASCGLAAVVYAGAVLLPGTPDDSYPQETAARANVVRAEQKAARELERAYSIEIWTQASSDERADWDRQLEQIRLSLPREHIETAPPPGMSDAAWETGMRQTMDMLRQLEAEGFAR